jgi:hypothetical protein
MNAVEYDSSRHHLLVASVQCSDFRPQVGLQANLKLKQTNATMESLREKLEGDLLAGSDHLLMQAH